MPLEVGFIPAGSPVPEHGIAIPHGLSANTIDVLVSAPKTMSALYAALVIRERVEDAECLLSAHRAGVDAAVTVFNWKASSALVYRGGRHYTPQKHLSEMLEREPDALPERRAELASQAHAELRDPTVVERVESTGLRINQLFHDSHNEGRGGPHLHTHLFIDPEVTAAGDGRDYPRDSFALTNAIAHAVQMYDAAASQAISATRGYQVWLNDRTGRREIDGITEEMVSSMTGHTRCVPGTQFEQFVTADFVGYSL